MNRAARPFSPPAGGPAARARLGTLASGAVTRYALLPPVAVAALLAAITAVPIARAGPPAKALP